MRETTIAASARVDGPTATRALELLVTIFFTARWQAQKSGNEWQHRPILVTGLVRFR